MGLGLVNTASGELASAPSKLCSAFLMDHENATPGAQQDAQEEPQPYRPTRRHPRTHAADDACNEPNRSRRRARPDIPASPEVREGHQPRRCESTLQHISQVLQVSVAFFFEGAPQRPGQPKDLGEAPSPAYVFDFLATSDGLALTKAFMRIKESKLRRRIVDLVEEIVSDE